MLEFKYLLFAGLIIGTCLGERLLADPPPYSAGASTPTFPAASSQGYNVQTATTSIPTVTPKRPVGVIPIIPLENSPGAAPPPALAVTTAPVNVSSAPASVNPTPVRTPPELININTASKKTLMKLPGVTTEDAYRIIDYRPYFSIEELVRRSILPPDVYRLIRNRITAERKTKIQK